ncbi:MAG: GNAT family N-acetyltransferase [Roseateles sp.]
MAAFVPSALRPATAADLAAIRQWRNHPTVRRVMFTRHEIGADEHAAWWARISESPRHRVLVLNCRGRDCGVVNFTADADTPRLWHWGFYLDPDAFTAPLAQLQAWGDMEKLSLQWAADELGADEIACEVFASNTAVLALHRRHRFQETGRYLRDCDGEQLEVVQLRRALR